MEHFETNHPVFGPMIFSRFAEVLTWQKIPNRKVRIKSPGPGLEQKKQQEVFSEKKKHFSHVFICLSILIYTYIFLDN